MTATWQPARNRSSILHSAIRAFHSNVPLAEQLRRRSAKPYRRVQLPYGTPFHARCRVARSRCEAWLNRRGNRVTHRAGADFFRGRISRIENVACAIPVGDGFADGSDDRIVSLLHFEAVLQHERSRQDLCDRIRQIFAGDIGGGATGWFVEAEESVPFGRAKTGAGQHSEGS